ncbi:transporter substrate-binding domain-containing protein [Thiohalocapsa marina]|uniref:histidine kinase n=1 Tax=Thiohalocapsa marina TaxID=424902 RepID=A0A5M8FPD4_9GAMM|nr:transporter substrate-binding domain-containing protein [Thiohalocapsa marina]KAA6186667.1 transporter substrate-binding domain-containing protein [Thiohalocapsa marina]
MKRVAVVLTGLGLLVALSAQARLSEADRAQLTERERAWLDAGHRVRARVADYPPYMLKEQPPAGLALDYLSHIAERFGFEVEYVAADTPFSEAFADVAGERRMYDLLPTFTRTPERERQFAITADYLSAPWVIFVRRDSPYIIGLEGLDGKTVVIEQGFLIASKLRQDFPRINVVDAPTSLDALMALATGQADAYVGNLAVGTFMVKEHRLNNLMVVAPTPYGINTQAMAVRADWPGLADLITRGIASMSREDHNAILRKWLTLEMPPRTDYTLAWTILLAASLVLLAVFYWNRRLASEVKTRQQIESRLRSSETRLQQEAASLQQAQTELQHKKETLQELNTTLETRLRTAVEDRTRALREAAARAQESNQAKSAFLSAVSHELRAPLHDILGYAQLLARQVPPQARSQLGIIQDSGNQLLRLINDILDFSRGDAKPIVIERAPLSLRQLARQLTAVYRPLAERGNNRFIARLDLGGLDWVLTDDQRLTQVLRNLLENACKFTKDGHIELGIERAEPPDSGPDVAMDSAVTRDEGGVGADALVRFYVSDTGVGIPESKQATIFQPFQRLERHRGLPGIGLGLAIAQQLTVAMGGRILLRSDRGETAGSTFSFELRLPTSTGRDPDADEDASILGYQGRRRTLLIADDQPTSRHFLAECCRSWGFRVLVAGDGAEALAHFRTADPPVDAVLVDQFMPRLDGWGFLHEARSTEQGHRLPVILISAAPVQRPDAFPEAMTFDRFVMKPVFERQLARILAEVLSLDWEYAPDASSAGGSKREPVSPAGSLSAEERGRLRDMVAIGQVIEIQRWAIEMAEQHPERDALWQGIIAMCSALDLSALRRLAEAADDLGD